MVIAEIFRRIWGHGGAGAEAHDPEAAVVAGVPGAFDFDDLIAKLQIAKMEVDRVRHQILEEVRAHTARLIEAVKRKDRDAIQIHAAEIVLKKKLLAALTTYSRLLELTIVRVQDARSIESLAKALAPLEYALRAMDDYLAATSPEVAARLASVVETAERVVRSTSFLAGNLPRAPSPADLDPEVQREIARVMAEVSREVNELVPSVGVEPVEPARPQKRAEKQASSGRERRLSEEEIDKALLDYIKRKGGVVKLSEAAKELGVSKEEVVMALRRLHRKGLIKISGAEASKA
jgi:predicted transcriptional regulator